MSTQMLKDQRALPIIYQAVQWLVRAAHATSKKTGEPANVVSASFDFPNYGETWVLEIRKVQPPAEAPQ
jgi:hypothetical protein